MVQDHVSAQVSFPTIRSSGRIQLYLYNESINTWCISGLGEIKSKVLG